MENAIWQPQQLWRAVYMAGGWSSHQGKHLVWHYQLEITAICWEVIMNASEKSRKANIACLLLLPTVFNSFSSWYNTDHNFGM